MTVSLDDIYLARNRISGVTLRTPVLQSRLLNELAGSNLYFKCENFQRIGAFKFRGASNAVLALTDRQASQGVVTHSSGNHGAALARAATMRGIPAHIVVPVNAPPIKLAAIRSYGGLIHECGPLLADREALMLQVVSDTGALFIAPYDDPLIIAGQGTAGLEILEQVPDLEVVITPVGGGGLLSGVATAIKETDPGIKVYGAEPQGADDASRSFRTGQRVTEQVPETIADGLRTTLGQLNFEIIQSRVDDILCITDDQIIQAMRLIWTRMKILVEPSAAVTLAAVLANKAMFAQRTSVLLLSGGNLDPDHLPW